MISTAGAVPVSQPFAHVAEREPRGRDRDRLGRRGHQAQGKLGMKLGSSPRHMRRQAVGPWPGPVHGGSGAYPGISMASEHTLPGWFRKSRKRPPKKR